MLSFSVRNGHLPVVQYLIERGQCYAMCTDNFGQTPLHYASTYVYMFLKHALVNSILLCVHVSQCVCVCCSECMVYFNLLALKYKACMIIIVVNSTFSLL